MPSCPFEVLRYDRSVSPDFLSCFLPSGFASSVLQYAQARYPIDFQFRKNPKTNAQWATLYVGMTAVLNIEDKKANAYRLTAHEKYRDQKHGWREEWATSASSVEWAARWPGVEDYLERIIPSVMTDGRLTATEGLVQAAVSVYHGDTSRVTLDREVIPHFLNTRTKDDIQALYSAPLANAIRLHQPVAGEARTPFGMKCDVLMLDAQGHLIAVEVKPGSVSSLAWVPAQATMYSRVLQHWIDHDPDWARIIAQMFEQRLALGLVPDGFTLPKLKPTVVPAVAFQRVAKQTYIDRMFKVRDALVTSGVNDPALRFYTVSLSGRLDPVQSP